MTLKLTNSDIAYELSSEIAVALDTQRDKMQLMVDTYTTLTEDDKAFYARRIACIQAMLDHPDMYEAIRICAFTLFPEAGDESL